MQHNVFLPKSAPSQSCLNVLSVSIFFTKNSQNYSQSQLSSKLIAVSCYCLVVAVSSTLLRRSDLCIPRNETARPHSQFPHSCICDRFIYSQDRSTFSILRQQIRQTDPGNICIYRSQIHECRNSERGRAVSFLGIFVSNFWCCVFTV